MQRRRFSDRSRIRSVRHIAAALLLAISGVPNVAAATDPPPPPTGSATPGNALMDSDTELPSLPPGGKLRVATYLDPPFAMKDETGQWTGLAVELWHSVADKLGVQYELTGYDLPIALFDAVKRGDVDVVASAVPVTKVRIEDVEYSTTFLSKVFSIATVPVANSGFFENFGLHFSSRLRQVIAAIVLLFVVSSVVIHLLERKRNPDHFGGRPLRGIGEALWWTAATVTTVGYGDRAPVTAWGRLFAVGVMFVALILISVFTAIVTSQLTVVQLHPRIRSIADLVHARVGIVEGSPMTTFLADRGVAYSSYPQIESAVEALVEMRIDAVVSGEPELRYLADTLYLGRIDVVPGPIDHGFVAFVLPSGSAWRRPINAAMVELLESPSWPRLRHEYLRR